MYENNLMKLLSKQFLTLDELQYLDENVLVTNVENCGNSGRYLGYIWCNVKIQDGQEYDVYYKGGI